MLRVLAADAARIEGVEVVVTWAASLEPFGVPGVEVVLIETRNQEAEEFQRLLWETDRTLHVAPDDALYFRAEDCFRAEELGEYGRLWLGCTPEAVGKCDWKPDLLKVVAASGVRAPFYREGDDPPLFPFLRKRDHGTGEPMALFRDEADLRADPPYNPENPGGEGVFWDGPFEYSEAYVSGRPCSVAVINAAPLPAGEQHIQIEGSPGRLSYHGGTVPAAGVDAAAVNRLVAQVYAAVPGLRGWWGIDFVIPDRPFEGSRDPVLIEVNPRLTTSYLGYRALTDDNLAERVLFPERNFPPIRWKAGAVRFAKAGTVDVSTRNRDR